MFCIQFFGNALRQRAVIARQRVRYDDKIHEYSSLYDVCLYSFSGPEAAGKAGSEEHGEFPVDKDRFRAGIVFKEAQAICHSGYIQRRRQRVRDRRQRAIPL